MEKVCFKSKSGFHSGVSKEWAERAESEGYGYVCDETGKRVETKTKKKAPKKK